jgi:hypothetical protein
MSKKVAVDECPIPSKELWVANADTTLVYARAAWTMATFSEKKIAEKLTELGEPGANHFVSGISRAAQMFRQLADDVQTAADRIADAADKHLATV